jgi:hypothetical protein
MRSGRDVPLRGVEVEIGPLGAQQFALAGHRQQQQLGRRDRRHQQVADRVVVDLLHDHADVLGRHGGVGTRLDDRQHVAGLHLVEPAHGLRHVAARPIEQRLVDPAPGEGAEAQAARVSGLLCRRLHTPGFGRGGADRRLLALAVHVVLEAPGLRARRHNLQHLAATIGQVVALVRRLRVADRRGLQDVDLPQMGPRTPPVAPNAAPSLCDVKKQPETPEDNNPSRVNDPGFCMGLYGASGDVPGPRHMWSIITSQSAARPHEYLMCIDPPMADGPVHGPRRSITRAAASCLANGCSDGT